MAAPDEKDKLPDKSLNPRLPRRRRRQPSQAELVAGILAGNRVLLGQAITLIESARSDHQELAQAVLAECMPQRVESFRLGVTGAPGVGKSTFIEALGQHAIDRGRRLAVLAVDPSSQVTGGSILGDKTRMAGLAQSEQAFIRPSPAGDSLGGVSRKTREAILLCEAAGYDLILVETVGVGQSEIAVHAMVDFFLLLLLPGAGDELQGIKRGIVEMADLIAVNKADAERRPLARQAQRAYRNALHLFPPKSSGWSPEVAVCSGLENEGIAEIWELLQSFRSLTHQNGHFHRHRRQQARNWLYESIDHRLRTLFYTDPRIQSELTKVEASVLAGDKSPFQGAAELLQLWRQ